jgi:hypothetical protein
MNPPVYRRPPLTAPRRPEAPAAATFTREFRDKKMEMAVAVEPTACRTAVVVLSGDGVPSKVGIGAFDLPLEDWLRITNRHRADGPYTRAERVAIGMIALSDNPHQTGDQTMSKGGATFRLGTRAAVPENEGEVADAPEEHCGYDVAPWLVTWADGRKTLMVLPKMEGSEFYDSFGVADYLAPGIHGEFCIEAVDAGQMTAAADLRVPGWTLLMDRTESIGVEPTLAAPRP